MIDYRKWVEQNFTRQTLDIHGKAVALWCTPAVPGRRTLLLVHGITGDRFGLVPLVEQLSKQYNCLLVELPGHGASDFVSLRTATDLQHWFGAVYERVTQEVTEIDAVVAHSFGCTAVIGGTLSHSKVVLLNPVPQPSAVYRRYAQLIMRFAGFWAIFYNARLFILLRSMALAKVPGRESWQRIKYVSRHSRPRYKQIVYQAGLVDIIVNPRSYKAAKDAVDLVVCGLEDTTALQRDSLEMAQVFGGVPVEFLRGGHLVPIESPARVAELIKATIG